MRWRRERRLPEDTPTLVRGSAPPFCTPLALAFRDADSVASLASVILSLDGAVPISTPTEVAEDEARWGAAAAARPVYQPSGRANATANHLRNVGFGWVYPDASDAAEAWANYWTAGQCTLLDELLSALRDQNLAALKLLLGSGWRCTPLQAERTLHAVLEYTFSGRSWSDAGLELLLTDTGRCGALFRQALSSDGFVAAEPAQISRRPLAWGLEYHEFGLVKLLLEGGAVFLPCDDAALSAIAARADVCTCTPTAFCSASAGKLMCLGETRRRGELLVGFLACQQAQQLVMARQRLSFASAFHPRLSSSALSDAGLDHDVLGGVGALLANLRPGWLGREANRALTAGRGY